MQQISQKDSIGSSIEEKMAMARMRMKIKSAESVSSSEDTDSHAEIVLDGKRSKDFIYFE